MTNDVLSVRDVRAFRPAITPLFSKKRAAARLRRLWRGYWDRQARRAIAVMLHALDDRTLADLGINRDAIVPLASRPLAFHGQSEMNPCALYGPTLSHSASTRARNCGSVCQISAGVP
jgi:uncharacterized protein YjiS (DUF1127 family)